MPIWLAVLLLTAAFAALSAWVSRRLLDAQIGWVRALVTSAVVFLGSLPLTAWVFEQADVIDGDRVVVESPIVVAFVAAFSVSIAQVTVGFFALDVLQLDASAAAQVAGIALTVVGVALVLSQTLMRRLSWEPLNLIRVGAVIAAVGFAATALAASPKCRRPARRSASA